MKFPSLLLLAALGALPAAAQAPRRNSTTQDIEAKVALESSVEKRLQAVLRQLLDSDDVVVIANAELLSDSERADIEVLPGVEVKATPGSPAPLELPASLVKKVSVAVFVDQSTPDAVVALAR